jgi:DNA polymerase III alpha subunit
MGKKDRELMAKQREKFLAGCRERGTTPPRPSASGS